MKKKTPKEFEEELSIKRNGEYEALDPYINDSTKIRFLHKKCGYIWKAKPGALIRNNKPCSCPKCSLKLKDFDEIVNELKNKNITILSSKDEFKNMHSKLHFKCNICNHEWTSTVANILYSNSGCPQCVLNKTRKSPDDYKKEFDKINSSLFNNEYELLTPYVNATTKIKIKHIPCGTISEKYPFDFLRGRGCKKCIGNNTLKTTEEFSKEVTDLTNNEYELVGEYLGNKKLVTIKHNACGKTFLVRPDNFISEHISSRCPYCGMSGIQNEITDFIKSLGIAVTTNDRTVLSNKQEIDIYVPEKKIGFEIDGLYWHDENHVGKNYHIDKLNQANLQGIKLINIFEDEYTYHKDIVLSKIKYILSKATTLSKIYARKCTVRKVSMEEKKLFLEKNHVQGNDNSQICLGLIYNNVIVSIMTFFVDGRSGIGHISNNKNNYELVRFASSIDHIVAGGFGKLLKYFITEYKPAEIYSYADLRWCSLNDNIYIKNNFKLTVVNKPNYWYYQNKKRYHRFGFRKSILKTKFPEVYDDNLTEFKIMDKTQYRRIWDCGTARFDLTFK